MKEQLMEGITVLSQNIINNGFIMFLYMVSFAACFFLALAAILIAADSFISKERGKGIISLIFVIPIVITLCTITYLSPKKLSVTQYKVTISEVVKLKDFNEKYEIINQDGEIYTIVEKDNG